MLSKIIYNSSFRARLIERKKKFKLKSVRGDVLSRTKLLVKKSIYSHKKKQDSFIKNVFLDKLYINYFINYNPKLFNKN